MVALCTGNRTWVAFQFRGNHWQPGETTFLLITVKRRDFKSQPFQGTLYGFIYYLIFTIILIFKKKKSSYIRL